MDKRNKTVNTIVASMLLLLTVVISSYFIYSYVYITQEKTPKDSTYASSLLVENFIQEGPCGKLIIRNPTRETIKLYDPSLYIYSLNDVLVETIVNKNSTIIIEPKGVKEVYFDLTTFFKNKHASGEYKLRFGTEKIASKNFFKAKLSLDKLIEKPSSNCCRSIKENNLILYDKNRDNIIDGEFNSISQAVNSLPSGSILYIYPGTYNENILVNNKVFDLIGVGCQGKVVINGQIRFNNINHNSTLQKDYGVKIIGLYITSNFSISKALLRIRITDPLYNGEILIKDNDICFNKSISGGTPKGVIVIETGSSKSKVKITNNIINGKDSSFSGGALIYITYSDYTLIKNNQLYNSPYYGVRVNYSNNTYVDDNIIENTTHRGLYLYKNIKVNIKNNRINNVRDGVYLSNSVDSTVEANRIIACSYYGIYLYYSNSSKIIENYIERAKYGHYYYKSNDIVSTNNKLVSPSSRGIYLRYAENARFINDIINSTSYGIQALNSKNIEVIQAIIENASSIGIYASKSNYIKITDTNIEGPTRRGVYLSEVNDTSINGIGITLTSDRAIHGSKLTNITILNVKVNDTKYSVRLYYIRNALIKDNIINNTDSYALYIQNSINITVKKNQFINNYAGIYFRNNNDSVVVANNFHNISKTSIYMTKGHNTTIISNTINIAQNGLYFYKTENITASNNTVSNTKNYGVYSSGSSNITIKDNNIRMGERQGVYLSKSHYIIIENNTVSNNTYYGIYVYYSDNVNITNNYIANNTRIGIYIDSKVTYTRIINNILKDNGLTSTLSPQQYAQVYVNIYLSDTVSTVHLNENTFSFTIYNSGMLHLSVRDSRHYTNNTNRFDAKNNHWDVSGGLLAERIYDRNDNIRYAVIDASPDYMT